MKINSPERHSARSDFWLVLLFAFAIFFIQLGLMGAGLLDGLGGSRPLQAMVGSMGAGLFSLIARPILLFLFLNLLMTGAALFVARELSASLGARYRLLPLALLVLVGLWLSILWENARLFPGSAFAPGIELPPLLRFVSLWYGWLVFVLWLALSHWRREGRLSLSLLLLVLPVLAISASQALGRGGADNATLTLESRPNIIFIGIDSLRIDVVAGIGADSDLVPNMSHWLKKGAVFPLTYTSVARTYPSWMGILSGRYPLRSGARVNLMPPSGLDMKALLPALLREHGYKTVYAIDEKRFSNIDESYGFDVALGPRLGAEDFLASLYDDLPITNILSAYPLTSYLLPAHYVNRALPLTYQPDDFLQQVRTSLAQPSDKPLFMTVHFCLPHWPYVWGQTERKADVDLAQFNYVKAVRRADAQLGVLMKDLQASGRLENAIVVFLSDHGEALGLESDSPYLVEDGAKPFRMYGHGYDLMSPIQNQVVLGFVGFGAMAEKIRPAAYSGAANLMDIAPTVTDMIGVKIPWALDGQSLADVVAGKALIKERPVFMETEFDLLNMGNSMPDTARLLAEGAHLYHLTPQKRIELKPDAFNAIVRSKKRGVVYQGHILQVTPKDVGAEIELADQASRKLSRPSREECLSKEPCASLFGLLRQEYGKEFDDIHFAAPATSKP